MADKEIKELAARLDKIEDLLRARIPGGGVTDPPPDPWGGWFPRWPKIPFPFPFPFPQPGDPPPVDISRFTRAQIDVAKEMLKAERTRLDMMEKLLDEQIDALK